MRTDFFRTNAHSVLTFRKWRRKNFSLFLTLKKTIAIGVLSIVYFLSTPIKTVAITRDTSEVKMEYDLDEIEVSAQRSPALYSQVARIVSVIEKQEIEAIPTQSIQDLLEYVASVDVRQRGPEGVQADISIRGGTFDQTLILLNGINITDPQTGHHNLNLPVPLSQVERIEILEGPAARVYGPNAFSGAINIVTKQASSNSLNLAANVGSYGLYDADLSIDFASNKLKQTLVFNGKKSDGYINNTDFRALNAFYSNNVSLYKGELKFQFGLSGKGFGANSFYTPKYPNQYEATKTLFTSAKWEGNGKLHLSPAIYYRQHNDRFELFRNNPASWYSGHNYHLTRVFGTTINSWFTWAAGKTSFGVEFRNEKILSNVLGNDLDNPIKVPGENAQYTKADDRQIFSAFAEHLIHYNKWIFSAGIMANSISGSDLGLNIFPGTDISYEVFSGGRIFASFNTSLRMPSFTDLYYEGPTNIGNPELKPERSATIETGLKLKRKIINGHVLIFYRKGKDIIDWVKENETDEVWQPKNLTKINSAGAEVQTNFKLRRNFGEFYPNIGLSYFYNQVGKGESAFISNYVLDNLKHKLVVSANQNLIKKFSIDLKMVFQDREGSFTLYEETEIVGEVPYDPFVVFDGKLLYQARKIRIFASVNNIFDRRYYDIGNVVQPGRWFKLGINYRIGFGGLIN